jgi:hypothetical protein
MQIIDEFLRVLTNFSTAISDSERSEMTREKGNVPAEIAK